MCHNCLKSLFVKAVKRPQLRHTLSSPAWFPDSSQHILALSGSEAQAFSITPPASPPGLHCGLSCLKLPPALPSHRNSHLQSEDFWCPNGMKAFHSSCMGDSRMVLVKPVSPGFTPGGEFSLHVICPQQLQGCSVLFSLPNNPLGDFCFA